MWTLIIFFFFYIDIWLESQSLNKKHRKSSDGSMISDKRRKPVTVTDILFLQYFLFIPLSYCIIRTSVPYHYYTPICFLRYKTDTCRLVPNLLCKTYSAYYLMYYIPDFSLCSSLVLSAFRLWHMINRKNLCGNIFPWPCVSPYIVYMLREMDILEDWAAIRKVYV